MENIINALRQLDITNDNHWTADGQARLDTVRMLAADPSITRETIDKVTPNFTRATASTWELPKSTSLETKTESQNNGSEVNKQATEVVVQTKETTVSTTTDHASENKAEQSEMEALADKLKAAELATEEARKAKAIADKNLVDAQMAEDAARDAYHAALPVTSNVNVMQQYLRSQVETYQQQGNLQDLIEKSGVNLKQLLNAIEISPLDEALSKSNNK